jgi:phosphatidate phosphatase APP1
LLIPLLGLGLPRYAGGLILKSMFDDRSEASEFALLQRNAAIALREAINENRVVNLPVLGDASLAGLTVRVTRADDQGIETIDVVTKQPASYSWNEINLELFCQNLAQHIHPLT